MALSYTIMKKAAQWRLIFRVFVTKVILLEVRLWVDKRTTGLYPIDQCVELSYRNYTKNHNALRYITSYVIVSI